jgi:dihydrofolate reductase
MQVSAAADAKNILVMGGTRFIGLFLSRQLIKEGHQVSLQIHLYPMIVSFRLTNTEVIACNSGLPIVIY